MVPDVEAPGGPAAPPPHRPRLRFLVLGCALAVALGIGLFFAVRPAPRDAVPAVGGPAPAVSMARLNGPGRVGVPASGGGGGRPAVLLFFGAWCAECHTELPPLAAAVRRQAHTPGLGSVAVVGVDSEDSASAARSFVHSAGVTFPVGFDPESDVVNGTFGFIGDPDAVFIDGSGTIVAIHPGPLSPAQFTALERKLVGGTTPSGT